ncbi:MAG TPA: metal-sensitive transcriptional regulator [Clostridia bacterium]|nr:metal-sensitive transcriptional regulator [Clostridia bacterium]
MDNEKPTDQCSNCKHIHVTTRSDKAKKDLTARLNRIEGQIRGIKGMIEKDVYCDDVLNQIAAVQSAMNSVSRLILNNHMKSCMVTRIQAGETEVIDELLHTIGKMLR